MHLRALLVDDDRLLLDGFIRQLRQEPYEVLTTTSPIEALTIIGDQQIDVVISDEHMPEMDGCEFLAEVAQRYSHTVRIMLTGAATVGAAMQAINQSSVFRFLLKPCQPLDLKSAIRNAFVQRLNQRLQVSSLRSLARAEALIKAVDRHSPGLIDTILADPAEYEALRQATAECAELAGKISGLTSLGEQAKA